ncbi:MAG: aldolase/citrate lyase family protein [Planctomycetota bacterium]|jgi:4-hydroxy-2-oxoheptanedioate aldolase|nr:aldolase/citrate lyase family protein [Planctomycetota bacterium]
MSLEQARQLRAHWQQQAVIGPFVKSTDPATLEALAAAGFDFAVIDLEHGPHDISSLGNLIRGCEASGLAPIVRVLDPNHIGRALDLGAAGVQVPHVASAAAAADAVRRARFAPQGERGVCRFVRAAEYGGIPGSEYFRACDDALVIAQVEGQAGIAALDDILQVSGIDAIFVGVYDLSQSLGMTGQVTAPAVISALEDIARRSTAAGIPVGTFIEDTDGAARAHAAGCNYLCAGVDLEWMRAATASFVEAAHSRLNQRQSA